MLRLLVTDELLLCGISGYINAIGQSSAKLNTLPKRVQHLYLIQSLAR